MNDLNTVSLQLNSLTVYRSVLQDETVSRFARVLKSAQSGEAASFCEHYGAFLQSLSFSNDSLDFSAHLEQLLRYDENAFSRTAAEHFPEFSRIITGICLLCHFKMYMNTIPDIFQDQGCSLFNVFLWA